jgi:hypothetical protein
LCDEYTAHTNHLRCGFHISDRHEQVGAKDGKNLLLTLFADLNDSRTRGSITIDAHVRRMHACTGEIVKERPASEVMPDSPDDRRPCAESCRRDGRIRTLSARRLEECAPIQRHAWARQLATANQIVGVDAPNDDDIPFDNWRHGRHRVRMSRHVQSPSPVRSRSRIDRLSRIFSRDSFWVTDPTWAGWVAF